MGGLLHHHTAVADQFNFYPALNGSLRATNQLTLYASWNRASRMPTFTDLYYTTRTHIGNSNLKAEESEALEAGLRYTHPLVKANLTAFYMKGSNMIDWVKSSPEALWESTNHTRIHKKGFEANMQFDLREWLGANQPFTAFKTGYLYLQQERVDDNLISNYTLNHLRHKFTASLNHRLIGNLSLSWHFRWQERAGSYIQYIDGQPGELVEYKPYSILDLKALYRIRSADLFIHANNLFNTTHVDIGNIPQPGFWLSGGVTLKIN